MSCYTWASAPEVKVLSTFPHPFKPYRKTAIPCHRVRSAALFPPSPILSSPPQCRAVRAIAQIVIPTGAARFFLPRRFLARRAAQWRDRGTTLTRSSAPLPPPPQKQKTPEPVRGSSHFSTPPSLSHLTTLSSQICITHQNNFTPLECGGLPPLLRIQRELPNRIRAPPSRSTLSALLFLFSVPYLFFFLCPSL